MSDPSTSASSTTSQGPDGLSPLADLAIDDLVRQVLVRLHSVLEDDPALRGSVDALVERAAGEAGVREEVLSRVRSVAEHVVGAAESAPGEAPRSTGQDGQDGHGGEDRLALSYAGLALGAIENARLYRRTLQREHWLAATADITTLLCSGRPGVSELQEIADRAREVAEADMAWIVAGDDSTSLALQVISGVTITDEQRAGLSFDTSLSRAVVEGGVPLVVEDVEADPRTLDRSDLGWPSIGPAIVVPLGEAAGSTGVLALAWTHEHRGLFVGVDVALPASFARQAALALQLRRAREDRHRLALFEDRDRIGRDLHDLVIQRLFAIGLGLQGTARAVAETEVADRLTSAVDDLDATINDIRRTIFALGSSDASADVQSEVTRVVERAEATLKFRPRLRFEGPVRTVLGDDLAPDLIAVLAEALSNASKHADATAVSVLVTVGDRVVLTVTDNGRGLPPDVVESGLANIRERAAQRGGTCEIKARAGGGTSLVWAVPARQAS